MSTLNLRKRITYSISAPINIFLLLLLVFFSVSSRYFFSFSNFQNIVSYASTIGLMALGLTFVLLNGNIDLSVGSLLGLSSAVFVRSYNSLGLPAAILITLGLGVIVGTFHGLAIWKLGINSFIVTLASMIGIKGVLFIFTQENSFSLDDFTFTEWGSLNVFGIPVLGWIYLFSTIILYCVQQYTTHGRNLYYVGGNKVAARDAGINIQMHQLINFVLCSTFTAIASILLCSQLGASTPNTGSGYGLWTITAVALGGVRLRGGSGSVIMVLVGGLVIGVLRNGMNLLHVSAAYIYVVMGSVLLAVLIVDKYLGVFAQLRAKKQHGRQKETVR